MGDDVTMLSATNIVDTLYEDIPCVLLTPEGTELRNFIISKSTAHHEIRRLSITIWNTEHQLEVGSLIISITPIDVSFCIDVEMTTYIIGKPSFGNWATSEYTTSVNRTVFSAEKSKYEEILAFIILLGNVQVTKSCSGFNRLDADAIVSLKDWIQAR